MQSTWIVEELKAIHESIIQNCHRAVPFVQFMTKKMIKYGINVFVFCCSMTDGLLSFEVYTVDDTIDNSAIVVVTHLIGKTSLTAS